MKRRNTIVVFLLVAVMLLGVGYAALTDSLLMTGNVAALAVGGSGPVDPEGDPVDPNTPQDIFDAAIGFSAIGKDDTTTSSLTVGNFTNIEDGKVTDSVSFDVSGFTKVGDKAVITYTIKNQHVDLSAYVSKPIIAGVADEFEVEDTWVDGKEVAKGAAVNGTVTIKLVETPTEDVDAHTITLTFGVSTSPNP